MEIKRKLRLGPVGLQKLRENKPTIEGFGAHLPLLGLYRGDVVAILDYNGRETRLLAQVTAIGEGALTLSAFQAESEMGVKSS